MAGPPTLCPPDRSKSGWHWLKHRKSGAYRMAFWRPGDDWRVADRIGRTTIRSRWRAARYYTYHAAVRTPHPEPVEG